MPAFNLNHGNFNLKSQNVQSKARQICFSFSNKIIHVNFISWDIIFVFTLISKFYAFYVHVDVNYTCISYRQLSAHDNSMT